MDTTRPADRLFDYDVVDSAGNKIGSVDNVWVDQETTAPKFLGAKTGWLVSHTYVVPAAVAQIDDVARVIRLPFAEEYVKNAPTLSSGAILTDDDQRRVFGYYGDASGGAAPFPGVNIPYAAYGAERAAAYAQNATAAAGRDVSSAADRAENIAEQNSGAGYDRAPVNAVDNVNNNIAPVVAPAAAETQIIRQETTAREADLGRSAQTDRQPVEPVDTAAAGPVSNQASGSTGDFQIRKVIRRERIYVPVDVDREYVEVTPASGAGEANTVAQPNPTSQPAAAVSGPTANRNVNEVARSGDSDTRRIERPRSI